MCGVPIAAERKNGAQFPIKLDCVPDRRGGIRRQHDLLDEGQDSFLHHSQNMTVLAPAVAARKTFGHLPYRVATRRQSMSRPNMISMRLRRL